jgi:hypothetical protein
VRLGGEAAREGHRHQHRCPSSPHHAPL